MHTLDTALSATHRSRSWMWFAPLVILAIAAFLAQSGVGMTGKAHAAAGSINVTATVGPVTSVVANGCAANNMASFAINPGALGVGGTCAISFGSSNVSGITLSADDSSQADQFFTSASTHFVDHAGACGALTGDEVGYKVTAISGSVTQNLCGGSSSTVGTNTFFSAIPNDVPSVVAADTVCTTTAIGTTHSCTIGVNTFETGSDAPAGTYTGTITLTTS
ncbi:MAG: hypothetical protein JWM86_1066 [Thermoleophilia bacterium]|nr:hypothetical protein [Thermoleophilia bacterium]